jgi:hypothetical protein
MDDDNRTLGEIFGAKTMKIPRAAPSRGRECRYALSLPRPSGVEGYLSWFSYCNTV